jgi:biopolymer transport protein ExbD
MGIIANEAHGGDEPMAAINVTSLVDVMFCLLIMFMVATPLMSEEKLPIDIPTAKGNEITEEEFLYSVISIDAKGNVYLGVLPLAADKAEWSAELAANTKLSDDKRAFIQGDENVSMEKVVDVLAALKEAGVSQVGFVTDPRIGNERRAN